MTIRMMDVLGAAIVAVVMASEAFASVNTVPEPATMSLFAVAGLAGAGFYAVRKRSRQ